MCVCGVCLCLCDVCLCVIFACAYLYMDFCDMHLLSLCVCVSEPDLGGATGAAAQGPQLFEGPRRVHNVFMFYGSK